MLPLPELDNQSFNDITANSIKLIPRLFPQWTDENYHDPGITFIELLAWLTEMQHYYLNRVTVKNELKFLKLLGTSLHPAARSRADVTFDGLERQFLLPRGTRLAAGDQFFETEAGIMLLPVEIERILVWAEGESRDCTTFNGAQGLSYYGFGQTPQAGNRLYLGLDRLLPPGRLLNMSVHMYQAYPIKANQAGSGDRVFATARVKWWYYGCADGKPEWLPLKLVSDETDHMRKSGRIAFEAGAMAAAKILQMNDRARYWLMCSLEEEGFDLAPRISEITFNTVTAVQGETFSETMEFSGTGEADQEFCFSSYLAYYGRNLVQLRDADGNWRECREVKSFMACGPHDRVFTLSREQETKTIRLNFGDGRNGLAPAVGVGNIRVISFPADFEARRWLDRTTGLPGQVVSANISPLVRSSFRMQVGSKDALTGDMVWQDWELVEDFDRSGPGDRHYILDELTGEITLGNNENGILPPVSREANIVAVACCAGGGERGNVKEFEINRISGAEEDFQGLKVFNKGPASGGREKETMEQAKYRVREELTTPSRAVTSEDFERIALNTPGLRVARACAIPLFVRGLKGYPDNSAPAQVTVAVIPYSEYPRPVASPGFLTTVKHYLDRHRLVTTQIHVVPPDYVEISVFAVVVTAPGTRLEAADITRELGQYLQPVDPQDPARGWPFGRRVYKGDIYGIINRLDGVEYIKDLWLKAEGIGVEKDVSGDILMPPHGLACLGECEIKLVNRNDL
jgi:hypothetical protein